MALGWPLKFGYTILFHDGHKHRAIFTRILNIKFIKFKSRNEKRKSQFFFLSCYIVLVIPTLCIEEKKLGIPYIILGMTNILSMN